MLQMQNVKENKNKRLTNLLIKAKLKIKLNKFINNFHKI